jgi:dTDP-4-dehydrorhamnose reductase
MILVFGDNGMLGRYMISYLTKFHDVKGINRCSFDVYELFKQQTLYTEIEKLINLNKPDYIINCIGNISKNRSDVVPNNKYVINSYFPVILSEACKKNNIILIHATTDCVFSGNDSFYKTDYIPDPVDDYGLSKFLGERIHACVIRGSIIGEEKNNSRSLISWIKSNANKTVNGYTNHFWNGLTCLEYVEFVNEIINKKTHWIGIKHIGSKFKENNFITKYDLVKTISEIYNLNVNVIPFNTEKNCNRTLSCDYIRDKDLYVQIKELRDYNNNNNNIEKKQ